MRTHVLRVYRKADKDAWTWMSAIVIVRCNGDWRDAGVFVHARNGTIQSVQNLGEVKDNSECCREVLSIDDGAIINPEFACPNCGNRDGDQILPPTDDDTMTCMICDEIYRA